MECSTQGENLLWRWSVKVGDLVSYTGSWNYPGIVLWVEPQGWAMKVLHDGQVKWFMTHGCEVVSEAR